MANKTPGSDTWELALRGKQLWEYLAESIRRQGQDPLQLLGWMKTGIHSCSLKVSSSVMRSLRFKVGFFSPLRFRVSGFKVLGEAAVHHLKLTEGLDIYTLSWILRLTLLFICLMGSIKVL